VLPGWLRPLKRWDEVSAPAGTFGRIVNPSFQLLEGVIIPSFRKWTPRSQLVGDSFDKAFKGAPDRKLLFKNGSMIQFMTHEQDLDKFGGSALHFVGYDEPPPQNIRQECEMRLADFDGYEMFAMTPLKANTGWVRRDIFKRREEPGITVIRGSIHDNPNLSKEAVKRILDGYTNDLWRQAREFGDFVEIGGLIYPEFEHRVLKDPPAPGFVRDLDVVVGMDPGIRNAAFVWVGFDREMVAWVFDEVLLQDKTPADYVEAIRETNARWGLDEQRVQYVIDPAARSRTQVNAESVQSALMQLGLFPSSGQNNVEAGIQQVRVRLKHERMWISPRCAGLRDEADEYAAEDREDKDQAFKVVKQNDHRLDSLRYAVMERVWDPVLEQVAPKNPLGLPERPPVGVAPPWDPDKQEFSTTGPLGPFS
jgi:phage terminase large subunit-like protein